MSPFSFRTLIIAVLAAILLLFGGTLFSMTRKWLSDDQTGFLILAISVYMVWIARDRLRSTPLIPDIPLGSLITVLGCLLFLAGKLSCTSIVQNVSVVVVLTGLIWLICGKQHVKVLCVPLGYLVFMLGVFEELLAKVSTQLQYISAWIAYLLLFLMGMPVHLHDQYLEMPHITLEVAEVCSGVHHIVAFVSMAVPFVYLTQRTWFGKLAFVVISFIIGVFANGFRVALIGMWTSYKVGGPLHGPWEIFYATFIAIFGMMVMVLISWIISKLRRNDRQLAATVSLKSEGRMAGSPQQTSPMVISLMILLATSGFSFFYSPVPVLLRTPLQSFPNTIGSWSALEAVSSPVSYEGRPADDSLRRIYRNLSGEEVQVYIANFASQEAGKKLVDDRFPVPEGNGRSISLRVGDQNFEIKKIVRPDNGASRVLYYWYDANGKILTDRYRTKLAHVTDAIVWRRTNASLILVSTVGNVGSATGASSEPELEFVQMLLPLTRDFLNDV